MSSTLGSSPNESRGHPIRKPELSDYDITAQQYDRHIRQEPSDPYIWAYGFVLAVEILATMMVAYLVTGDVGSAVGLGVLIPLLGFPISLGLASAVGGALSRVMFRVIQSKPLDSEILLRIQQYDDALQAYWEAIHEQEQQKRSQEIAAYRQKLAQRRTWTSLSGKGFESAVGHLLKNLGYDVVLTGGAGDRGIDLLVSRGDTTTVVQCKQHKAPASPAVIRELYGAMVAYGADQALLACTGGFTQGTKDFAEGKPIILWSVDDLICWSKEWDRRKSGDK